MPGYHRHKQQNPRLPSRILRCNENISVSSFNVVTDQCTFHSPCIAASHFLLLLGSQDCSYQGPEDTENLLKVYSDESCRMARR